MKLLTPIIKNRVNSLAYAGYTALFERLQKELLVEVQDRIDGMWPYPVTMPSEEVGKLHELNPARWHYESMKSSHPRATFSICKKIWHDELTMEEKLRKIAYHVRDCRRYPEVQGFIIHPARRGDVFTDPQAHLRIYSVAFSIKDRSTRMPLEKTKLKVKGLKVNPGMGGTRIDTEIDPKDPPSCPIELDGYGFIQSYRNAWVNDTSLFEGRQFIYRVHDDIATKEVVEYLKLKAMDIVDESMIGVKKTIEKEVIKELGEDPLSKMVSREISYDFVTLGGLMEKLTQHIPY